MTDFDPDQFVAQLSEEQELALEQALRRKRRARALEDIAQIVREYGISQDEVRQALLSHENEAGVTSASGLSDTAADTSARQGPGIETGPQAVKHGGAAPVAGEPIRAVDAASYRLQSSTDPNPVPGADQFEVR